MRAINKILAPNFSPKGRKSRRLEIRHPPPKPAPWWGALSSALPAFVPAFRFSNLHRFSNRPRSVRHPKAERYPIMK